MILWQILFSVAIGCVWLVLILGVLSIIFDFNCKYKLANIMEGSMYVTIGIGLIICCIAGILWLTI